MQDELQDLGWGGMEGQSSFLLLCTPLTFGNIGSVLCNAYK